MNKILSLFYFFPFMLFGHLGYISNYGLNTLDVIDTQTQALKQRIILPQSSGGPVGFTFSKNLKLIYVTNFADNGGIYQIDANSGLVLKTISTSPFPYDVVVSASKKAFVSNNHDNSVSIYDLAQPSCPALATIPVGVGPEILQLDREEKFLYVVNAQSGDVSVIDLYTYKEIKKIPVGNNPRNIHIDPKRNLAYVCVTQPQGNISVIDLNSLSVTTTISPLIEPSDMTFTRDGSKAYVSEFSTSQQGIMKMVDLNTFSINPENIVVANVPFSLAFTPDEKYIYVCSALSNGYITILDASTLLPVSTSPITLSIGGQLIYIKFPYASSNIIKALQQLDNLSFQKGLR